MQLHTNIIAILLPWHVLPRIFNLLLCLKVDSINGRYILVGQQPMCDTHHLSYAHVLSQLSLVLVFRFSSPITEESGSAAIKLQVTVNNN